MVNIAVEEDSGNDTFLQSCFLSFKRGRDIVMYLTIQRISLSFIHVILVPDSEIEHPGSLETWNTRKPVLLNKVPGF